jgi:hypothetical protein
MAKHQEIRDKSIGIVILTVFCFALGVFALATAIIALVFGSDTIANVSSMLGSLDAIFVGTIGIVFACLFFAIGVGFRFLRGWAKSILLVLTALGVILYPLRLALFTATLTRQKTKINNPDIISLVMMIIGAVLSLFIVWYISRQKLILTFEAREMELIERKIKTLDERIELGRQRCNAGEMSKAELRELRSDCKEKESVLRGKKKHLEKLRLSRDRKLKEKAKAKEKAKKDKRTRKEEKKVEREEKKSEREEKRAEKKAEKEARKEEEEKEADEEGEGEDKEKPSEEEEGEEGSED